jgi:hypothetical protein
MTYFETTQGLAKLDKVPAPFALSVLGAVARNSGDPQLRREAYHAIENLTLEPSSVEKLDAEILPHVLCESELEGDVAFPWLCSYESWPVGYFGIGSAFFRI